MKELGVYIAASLILSFTIGIGGGVFVLGGLPTYSHIDSSPTTDNIDVLDDTANLTVTPPPAPWDNYALTVGIYAEDDYAYTPIVQDAITYWNTDGRQYDRPPVGLILAPDHPDPDIRIHFISTPFCGPDIKESTAGCAPILAEDDTDRTQDTVAVQVRNDYTTDSTRFIVIHELGHVFGLTHSDAPHEYMKAGAFLEPRDGR